MKFSIIITSTRPHLLQYALQSAAAQKFDDYEIVVSDNSAAGCEDLVKALGGPKTRYVRPESPMALVAHWEFAFRQARGDWHLLLCDDDAVTPNLLSTLDEFIGRHPDVQSLSWGQGVYSNDAQWSDASAVDQLGVDHFSGAGTRYDAKQLLAEMFNSGSGLFRVKRKIPFFPRAVCRRDILDAIRAEQGQLFHPFCPMTSGAAAVLAFSDTTLQIDLPLRVLGLTVDSCAGWTVDETAMETSHAGVEVKYAPIKQFRVLPTAQADALLRTQHAMPQRLGQYHLNYVNYFLHCSEFLDEVRASGVDEAPYRRFFEGALAEMPADIQASVRAAIAAANQLPEDKPLLALRARVGGLLSRLRKPRLPGRVNAKALGLHNIFDCAGYLGAFVDAQSRRTSR